MERVEKARTKTDKDKTHDPTTAHAIVYPCKRHFERNWSTNWYPNMANLILYTYNFWKRFYLPPYTMDDMNSIGQFASYLPSAQTTMARST